MPPRAHRSSSRYRPWHSRQAGLPSITRLPPVALHRSFAPCLGPLRWSLAPLPSPSTPPKKNPRRTGPLRLMPPDIGAVTATGAVGARAGTPPRSLTWALAVTLGAQGDTTATPPCSLTPPAKRPEVADERRAMPADAAAGSSRATAVRASGQVASQRDCHLARRRMRAAIAAAGAPAALLCDAQAGKGLGHSDPRDLPENGPLTLSQ